MGLFRSKPKSGWDVAHNYLEKAEKYKGDIDVKVDEYSELASEYQAIVSDMIDEGINRYQSDPNFRYMVISVGVGVLVGLSIITYKRRKSKKVEE